MGAGIIIILVFIALFALFLIWGLASENFLLILIAIAWLVFVCFGVHGEIQMRKDLRQNKQKEQEKQEALERKRQKSSERIVSGDWRFLADTFFKRCRGSNITNFDNEFSIAKGKNIIVELIKEYSVNRKDIEKILTVEKLKELYSDGKASVEKAEYYAEMRKKVPSKVSPNQKESTFLHRSATLAKLSGTEKRKQMLTDLHQDYKDKIKAKKEGEEALRTLGMVMMQQQQKETSWGVMAGIANGIAGPGAAAAVAVDTAISNAQVRAHNAAISKATVDMLSGIPDLQCEVEQLETDAKAISRQIELVDSKVVLSKPTSDDICNNIKILNTTVKKSDSGVLHITIGVSFKKVFELDVPEGVRMAVDGVLQGTVTADGNPIGTALFPLPLYGIPSDMFGMIELNGLCDVCLACDTQYAVKMADTQNLWIMEA